MFTCTCTCTHISYKQAHTRIHIRRAPKRARVCILSIVCERGCRLSLTDPEAAPA